MLDRACLLILDPPRPSMLQTTWPTPPTACGLCPPPWPTERGWLRGLVEARL